MIESEGYFRRYKPVGYFAVVTIRVNLDVDQETIAVRCSGGPMSGSQGRIEDVPAVGFDDWKAGAMVGVQFARRIMAQRAGTITITRIAGLITDTNPTIIAAAAADAVWKAYQYIPSPRVIHALEARVFQSWNLADDAIPHLDDV